MGTVVALAAGRVNRMPLNASAGYLPNRFSIPHDVNVKQPSALAYWCRHFDTSVERLLAAVKKVGTNPSIVRLELRVR